MKEDISEKEKTAALLAENRGEAALFQRRENLQKHTSYASERMQYEAIKNGQVERIRSVMQREPDGTPGILSKDQLRNSKNMFIAGITLFTRVEECVDRDSIEKLSAKAAERFAQEVRKYGNPSYSRAIECAVRYIHLHLHNPSTLEEVSKAAGISSSYLSRTFRKETGMSIVDYIQKQRIEAACNMLSYSDYTASQIGEYLCFSNQSYFIRIFKKFTGMTPAKYRKYSVRGRIKSH